MIRFMNLGAMLAGLALAAGVAVGSSRAATPQAPADPWQTRLPAFSVEGPSRGENAILLYFTADWCGFCKRMERTTLADDTVRLRVASFRAHKIDFDAQRGLVDRFGIRGIPAFVMTNDRGEVIDRLTGAVEAEAYLLWLQRAEAAFALRSVTDAQRLARMQALPAAVMGSDAKAREDARDMCWKLAGRGDPAESAMANGLLRELLRGEPQLWRAGLGHADLAVRVAAARLLKEESGGAKDFDPWAEPQVRAAALAALGY